MYRVMTTPRFEGGFQIVESSVVDPPSEEDQSANTLTNLDTLGFRSSR